MFERLIETQGVRWGGTPNIPPSLSGGGAERVSLTQGKILVTVMADVIRSNQSPYDRTGSNGGYFIEADVSSAETGVSFHGTRKIEATIMGPTDVASEVECPKTGHPTTGNSFPGLSNETSGEIDAPLQRSRERVRDPRSQYDNKTQSVIANLLKKSGCSEQQAFRLASQSATDYDQTLLKSIVDTINKGLTVEDQEEAAAIAQTPREWSS